jgi:hypothetical protein
MKDADGPLANEKWSKSGDLEILIGWLGRDGFAGCQSRSPTARTPTQLICELIHLAYAFAR